MLFRSEDDKWTKLITDIQIDSKGTVIAVEQQE